MEGAIAARRLTIMIYTHAEPRGEGHLEPCRPNQQSDSVVGTVELLLVHFSVEFMHASAVKN